MSGTAKNLIVILGIITVAFAGYYLYTMRDNMVLQGTSGSNLDQMLADTQVFLERDQQLNRVELNIAFFEDDRFQSLRTYLKDVPQQPIGRTDPFAEVGATTFITNTEE